MMIRGFFTTFLMKQRLGIFGFGKASLGLGLLLISINSDLSVQIYIFSPVCFYTDGKFDGGNFSAFNTKYAKMRQRGEGDTLTFDLDRFGEKNKIRFYWSISEQ